MSDGPQEGTGHAPGENERGEPLRTPGLPTYAIVVILIVLVCIVALSFLGTSAPGLHYYPGGSSLGS